MSLIKKMNFDTANFLECFKALLGVQSQIQHATVLDRNRTKYSVKRLGDVVYGYVPRSSDNIRINSNGGIVLIDIIRSDWLHYKGTWYLMGINAGSLPDIIDRHGNPAPMTMNGIPIDISDVKVLCALNKITKSPPDITTEALHEIQKAMEMYIEFDIEWRTNEPLGVLYLLQSCHIKTQNKLYINKSRIKETLHASVSKMVHNHVEAIAMKDSVKLNSAMLEQAECMLTSTKDKE
jgi:hypothetical protein